MEAKVKIAADGVCGSVFVNGQELQNATAVRYVHEAGQPPRLVVELLCDTVEIEAEGVTVEEVKKQHEDS